MRRRAMCNVCGQEREVTYAAPIGRQLCDECLGDLIAYCASFGRPDDEEPWVRPLRWLAMVEKAGVA